MVLVVAVMAVMIRPEPTVSALDGERDEQCADAAASRTTAPGSQAHRLRAAWAERESADVTVV